MEMPKGFSGGLEEGIQRVLRRPGCPQYLASLPQASQRYSALQRPREDVPGCHRSPGCWHQDVHMGRGTVNHISPQKERHEGRGGEERSKQQSSSSRRQGEERQQENKTSPKISLQFAVPQTTNPHLEGSVCVCVRERSCKLCFGVPREPFLWLSQAAPLEQSLWGCV